MTPQQAKQFARLWIGNLVWEVAFDSDSVDCPDEDKSMIKVAIDDQFFKLLGNKGMMSPQDIYDVIVTDDSL